MQNKNTKMIIMNAKLARRTQHSFAHNAANRTPADGGSTWQSSADKREGHLLANFNIWRAANNSQEDAVICPHHSHLKLISIRVAFNGDNFSNHHSGKLMSYCLNFLNGRTMKRKLARQIMWIFRHPHVLF